MKKITKREKYEALIAALTTGECEIDPAELVEFCKTEIAALDRKSAKAKETAAAKRAEADELTEIVFEAVGDEYEPVAEIATRVDYEDATVGKITARLTKLVNAGKVEKEQVTVETDGKKRKVMGYRKSQA